MDPTHNRTYYFNTVTQQSQWTFPTAAAAIPFQLPTLANPQAAASSPGARRRVGDEFGGVLDMATNYGLPKRGEKGAAPAPSNMSGGLVLEGDLL